MDAERWIKQVIGADTINGAAVKAGITPTTLFRQVKKGAISVDNVIPLCRAYGHSPVSGLIETGYIAAEEAHSSSVEYALRHVTDELLVAEVLRRMQAARQHKSNAEEGRARPAE